MVGFFPLVITPPYDLVLHCDMAKRTKKANQPLSADMCILVFHGKEHFLIAQQTRHLQDLLQEKFGELESFTFDGSMVELATVLDELRSYGLMQNHKLVIVDNADQFLSKSDGSNRPSMERYAESPVDHATLLLRAGTWRAGKLDKAIVKSGGVVAKFDLLNDASATAWCVERASMGGHGVKLERAAAALLVERVGTNLTKLDTEIGRLAAMVDKGGIVTREVVGEAVGKSREEQGWEIQQAILTGRSSVALARLRELIEISRTPEVVLMWAVADLIRKLHAASQLLSQGMSPAVVAKEVKLWGPGRDSTLAAARKHPPARFADLLDEVLRADARAKSGLATSTRSLEGLTVVLADSVK